MMKESRPVHRTIVVVDVEGFGDLSRTNRQQVAVREGMYRAMGDAFAKAGLSWDADAREDRGDGIFVLIPPDVPKSLLVEQLPSALVATLRSHNQAHPGPERIRLRMALHAGEITYDEHGATGTAIILTFRLVDAVPLKAALAGSPGVLAIIVSTWFFDEVVRHMEGDGPAGYRPVTVTAKETSATGWICLPDGAFPAGNVTQEYPRGTVLAGQVVMGEIPREPAGFLAREMLAALAETASRSRVAVVRTLTGLRGVGKTQLAAAYARRQVSNGWALVAWVNAETTDTLLSGLDRIAGRLQVADPAGDSQESARRLREHLETRPGDSLLVFDNAADPDRLRPYLPAVGRTQVVITSTDQAFTELGEVVNVPVFSRSESLRYLQARTGLVGQEDADSVAEAVGDLPLALSQVAATIRRQQLSYRSYLERLRRVEVRDLLGAVPGGDYPQAAAAALLLSVQVIEASDTSGLISQLLRVVAVLSPHGVHRDLLATLAIPGGSGRDDPGPVDRALEMCTAGSVLAWSVAGEAVLMHRLLGRVLRERDQAGERWAATVSAALNLLEPCLFPRDQALARREEGTHLIAQVEALWDVAGTNTAAELRLRQLRARSWAVQQLVATADFSRAVAIGQRVLAKCNEFLGTDHPDTVSAQANLAYAYLSTGQLGRAIPLHEQALTGRERLLGPDHPDTLESRDHLAQAYMQSGHLDRALPLFSEVLADCERTMGQDHPDTFSSRNNLAAAYWSAGRREEAIALDEQTLAGRERTLGPDHPDTLTSRNNLAIDYQAAGRLDEAIALDEQALAGRERVLGHDHPRTLASRNNLAHDYRLAGRLDEAIALHEQVVLDSEKILDRGHPSVLAFWDNLAEAYGSAGRLDEAIPLHEQTLARREKILGREHPDTLRSQEHLADAYASAGRLDEAIALHQQTFARRERILGPDHPDTLLSRDHLERTRTRACVN